MSAEPVNRTDTLAQGLGSVRGRIHAAARAAGRDPDDITLIVVTKTYPAHDVSALAGLGVVDVGENRDQEAAAKRAAVEEHDSLGRLTWHLVGSLQTNKARSVARWADVVHSLDRPRVIDALARAAADEGRSLDVLIQVSLDGAPGRGGASPEQVEALADQIAGSGALRLRGVMAVAPIDADPQRAFSDLRTVSESLRRIHPDARWISAGMSGDLEAAVACGTTHVRVGSAILGARARLR
jgi:pyridoxal phosphate enzyme (YggS family)